MASIYWRGRVAWLRWTEDGRQHRISLGNISRAQAEKIRLEKTPSYFASWVIRYLEWHRGEYPDSHDRVKGIVDKHLLPVFGQLKLTDISPELVEKYKRSRIAAPATIAKELRTLNAILNRAVMWRLVSINQIHGRVDEPKNLRSRPPPYYLKEQLVELYKQSHYAPVWKLMANTGLRRGEAQQLKWEHIDKFITVESDEGARTKSGKCRYIPLSDAARDALKSLRGGVYVLPVVEPWSLSRAFKRDAKRAGIGGTLHWLRHTYCSHMVMAGNSLEIVRVLAGHSHIITTQHYAHLSPDFLKTRTVEI